MRRDELNAWIAARKAEGLWVTRCEADCGTWFAQRHKGVRVGRRACLCEKLRCQLWRRYWLRHGRAPEPWVLVMWKARHGDAPRKHHVKKYAEPSAMETRA